MSSEEIEEARTLLELGGVFFTTRAEIELMRLMPEFDDDDIEDEISSLQTLNLNDTFAWALAYGIKVADTDLPELARLFQMYGQCGVLYWASENGDIKKSQFHDVNRFIEFVRNEETILKELPGSSERAFTKRQYTIGETDDKP